MANRRLIGGIVFLLVGVLFAFRLGWSLGVPIVIGGFVAGWLFMRFLLRHPQPRPGGAKWVGAGAATGIALAVFVSNGLATVNASAPLILVAAGSGTLAGLLLSLRFSARGDAANLSSPDVRARRQD